MATRSIGVVAGSASNLQSFAASVLSKATKNAVALGGASESVSIALGANAVPKDAHTSVVTAAATSGPYAGAKVSFFRSVLPRGADDQLALRDALDVFASSGIDNSAEITAAKNSVVATAQAAVNAAKANGGKLTLLVKQVSKFDQVNNVFAEAVEQAAQKAGVSVEVVDSATATNNLIMFPERTPVVAAADTASADNIELALSGLYGASRTYLRASGKVAAGHSPATVALAVAEALKELGLSAEAKKVADAAAKGTNAESIVAAL